MGRGLSPGAREAGCQSQRTGEGPLELVEARGVAPREERGRRGGCRGPFCLRGSTRSGFQFNGVLALPLVLTSQTMGSLDRTTESDGSFTKQTT